MKTKKKQRIRTSADVNRLLESVISRTREQIQDAAEAYRRDVVLPVCSKHALEFMAGNGDWTFYMTGESGETSSISSVYDIDSLNASHFTKWIPEEMSAGEEIEIVRAREIAALHRDLDEIIHALDEKAIGNNDVFGYYIDDIKAKDWK